MGAHFSSPAEDSYDLAFREHRQAGSPVTQAVGLSPPMVADKQGLHPLESSLRAKAKQSSMLFMFIPLVLSEAAALAVSSGAEASFVSECRPEDSPQGTAGSPENLGIDAQMPCDHISTASKHSPLVVSCCREAEPQSSQCQHARPGA